MKIREIGHQLSGTVYFDGAGMRSAYIPDMIAALTNAGIANAGAADVRIWSRGVALDAWSAWTRRSHEGWLPAFEVFSTAGRLNLIGYSYGGLTAARIAARCTANGSRVDYLVLIGTPIAPAFLAALRQNPIIGTVLVIDLAAEGDPIRAGMSTLDLFAALPRLTWHGLEMLCGKPGGHFCLLERGEPGRRARRAIAAQLVAAGVR